MHSRKRNYVDGHFFQTRTQSEETASLERQKSNFWIVRASGVKPGITLLKQEH